MLDGITAYNQLRAAERAGVRGTALWRLGMEDPSLWYIWDATRPDDAIRAKVEEVPPGYDLIIEGQGDIWRITATPQNGRRTFDYDAISDSSTTSLTKAIRFRGAFKPWGLRRTNSRLLSTTGPIPRTRQNFCKS